MTTFNDRKKDKKKKKHGIADTGFVRNPAIPESSAEHIRKNRKTKPGLNLRKILYAPAGFWELSADEKSRICNGCGAAGKRDYIADRILGMDIAEVCNIHDYMYHLGEKTKDKADADRAFLDNLITMVDVSGGWFLLRILRRYLALKYYRAVKYFGGPAFWAGKL